MSSMRITSASDINSSSTSKYRSVNWCDFHSGKKLSLWLTAWMTWLADKNVCLASFAVHAVEVREEVFRELLPELTRLLRDGTGTIRLARLTSACLFVTDET